VYAISVDQSDSTLLIFFINSGLPTFVQDAENSLDVLRNYERKSLYDGKSISVCF